MITAMANQNVGAQGFISYTRKDNEVFTNVVDRLKIELEGRFHAATGRQLEIFLDRESIGWGEDWRSRIRDSVNSATFFIPVVTMRYFESDRCREELLAFYENAKHLGVTELILPIVLTGADGISADDAREEVRLIDALNYKDIEESWLSGYDSPAWLASVAGMVRELKKKLGAAETVLAARESSAEVVDDGTHEAAAAEVEADVSALGEDFAEMTALTEEAGRRIKELGEAASASTAGVDLQGLPPKQQQVALIKAAQALKGPAQGLAQTGGDLEKHVTRVDARLRAIIDELRTIDVEAAQQQLETLLAATSGLQELSVTVDQLNSLVQVLRYAALTNVSLRRSVQPAIQGIQSMSNVIATVESWRSI